MGIKGVGESCSATKVNRYIRDIILVGVWWVMIPGGGRRRWYKRCGMAERLKNNGGLFLAKACANLQHVVSHLSQVQPYV